MKKNNKLQLILIAILLSTFVVFFCCCGMDTSTVAGSASQVYLQEENNDLDADEYDDIDDEYDEEDSDTDDYDDSSESDDFDSEELDEDADADAEDEEGYVLNTNTKKFHYPDCYSVDQMKDKNKLIEETTREDLIERGYDPCGNCHP